MKTKHKLSVVLITLLFLDRIVTTLFWGYEANPFILEIGVIGLWITGIIFVILFVGIYLWVCETHMKPIANGLIITLITLYTVVFISNLFVVIS